MKQIFVIFLVFLISCDSFQSKKVSSDTLLEEEIQAINWNEVDEYPSFAECEDFNSQSDKKACFENYLYERLNTQLAKQKIIVNEDVSDTVQLKIRIDKEGEFSIASLEIDSLTSSQIPQLDSIIRHSFDNLPEIYPAIKRSQPVNSEFVLPIIINIQ